MLNCELQLNVTMQQVYTKYMNRTEFNLAVDSSEVKVL